MVVCYFNLSLMAKVSMSSAGGALLPALRLSKNGSADAMERRRRASVRQRMGWRRQAGLGSLDNNLDRAAPICYRSNLLRTYEPQINADERRYIKSLWAAHCAQAKRRWLGGREWMEAPGECEAAHQTKQRTRPFPLHSGQILILIISPDLSGSYLSNNFRQSRRDCYIAYKF